LSHRDLERLNLAQHLRAAANKKRRVAHLDQGHEMSKPGGQQAQKVQMSKHQFALIREALLANSNIGPLLAALSSKDIDSIVERARCSQISQGTSIILEGDLRADVMYIVEDGDLDVIKGGEKVHSYSASGSFGELALLFRAPRAATVIATTDVQLWELHRQELKEVMQARVQQKLEAFTRIIEGVDALKHVPKSDRKRLAEALVETTFVGGDEIIRQGDDGRTFFILYEGEVSVEVNGKEVMRYEGNPEIQKSDCFGERALEMEEPRAATVRALSNRVVVLALDRNVYRTVQGMQLKKESTDNLVEYRLNKLENIGLLGCGGFGKVTSELRCDQ